MSILHRFLRLVVLVVLIALGLGLMVISLDFTDRIWTASVQLFAEHRAGIGWLGAALFVTGFLYAASGYRRARRERFLTFDREEGTVSISTVAIEDYLGKLAGEFPSILRLRPRVLPGRKSIDIRIELRVKAGSQIQEVCELLNQRVRESMANGLGITDIRRLEVSVREIVSEHKQS